MTNNIKNIISPKSILKNNAIKDEQLPHKNLHRINLEGEEKFFDPQNTTSSQTIKKDDSHNNEDNLQRNHSSMWCSVMEHHKFTSFCNFKIHYTKFG